MNSFLQLNHNWACYNFKLQVSYTKHDYANAYNLYLWLLQVITFAYNLS